MQAAAPALVAVGFLMMTQVKHIDWDKYEIAIPAFLTIAVMPFTYSITNGIGAGFIAFVAHQDGPRQGAARSTGCCGAPRRCSSVYFAIDPIQQLLGMK